MSLNKMTKLVATIGPSTANEFTIKEMIKIGVNVFRLNFSHDSHESHKQIINIIRRVASKMGATVSILQDLQGPKIRVGKLPNDQVELKKGTEITLTISEPKEGEIPVQYKGLINDVNIDDIILLDDGNLELKVTHKDNQIIKARVIVGGFLKSNKGINLPTATISAPAITSKDIEDLKFGLENGVDFVALSFVRSKKDIIELRDLLGDEHKDVKIVAKIERHEALTEIEAIIIETDIIMVARGDLGVELGPDKVPIIQKKIIQKCRQLNKPVIVATQMLESMIKNPRPTRAEASDVANAILDGADAVMLSGETSVGEYPLESIKYIVEIAKDVERWVRDSDIVIGKSAQKNAETTTEAIASSIVRLAKITDSKLMLIATSTGKTTTVASSKRPFVPIISITHDLKVRQYMTILWGVDPYIADFDSVAEMVDKGVELGVSFGYVKKGDKIIVSSGKFPKVPGGTNIIEIKTV